MSSTRRTQINYSRISIEFLGLAQCPSSSVLFVSDSIYRSEANLASKRNWKTFFLEDHTKPLPPRHPLVELGSRSKIYRIKRVNSSASREEETAISWVKWRLVMLPFGAERKTETESISTYLKNGKDLSAFMCLFNTRSYIMHSYCLLYF